MNPFDILGVPADASETELKRAYARGIKQARPEEHPQEFQALHEAYVAALAMLDWQRPETDEIEDPPVIGAAQSATSSASAVQDQADPPPQAQASDSFDLPAFLDQLHAVLGSPETDIDAWLRQQPALYSLSLKRAITPGLVEDLSQRPALPPEALESLFAFFGIGTLNREFGWLSEDVEELRERSLQAHQPWASLQFRGENRPRISENAYDSLWPRIALWLLFSFMIFSRACSDR